MSCCKKQDSQSILFQGISQAEKDTFSEGVSIWSRQFPDQGTQNHSVKEGDLLSEIHFPTPQCSVKLQDEIRSAFVVTDRSPSFFPLIAEKIRGNF